MANRRGKDKQSIVNKESLNFGITAITVSVIFIFVGYLLGQYAVQMVSFQNPTTSQVRQSEQVSTAINEGLNQLQANTNQPLPASSTNPQRATERPTSQVASQPSSSGTLYRVQVGAFSQRPNAENLKTRLAELGYEAVVTSGPPFRVQTGAFSSRDNAQNLSEELRGKGFEVAIVN